MSDLPANPPEPTLSDIDDAIDVVSEVARPDAMDIMERMSAEREQLKNDLARSQIKNVKADRKMRKKYAGRILLYLEGYSGIVGLILIFAGFNLWGFKLPTEILATLVGSTALAAIGLVGFIARGLFRPPAEPQ